MINSLEVPMLTITKSTQGDAPPAAPAAAPTQAAPAPEAPAAA